MEVIPYTLGVVLFTFAVYWSAANAAAEPGRPVFGLFRFRESRNEKESVASSGSGGRRSLAPARTGAGVSPAGNGKAGAPSAGGVRAGAARGDALRRQPRR